MDKLLVLFFALFGSLLLHFLFLQIDLTTGQIQSSQDSVVEIGLYPEVTRTSSIDRSVQSQVSDRKPIRKLSSRDSLSTFEGEASAPEKIPVEISKTETTGRPEVKATKLQKIVASQESDLGIVEVDESKPVTQELFNEVNLSEYPAAAIVEEVPKTETVDGARSPHPEMSNADEIEDSSSATVHQDGVQETPEIKTPLTVTSSASIDKKNRVKSAIPRYDINPRPIYPDIALRKGWEGEVLLQVEVKKSGLVEKVFIKESSGFKALDRSAMKAVRRWQFVPAVSAGFPVSGVVVVPINYVLP